MSETPSDGLNAGVVLAALDQMLEPWTLHRDGEISALKRKIRDLRKHVAEYVEPMDGEHE